MSRLKKGLITGMVCSLLGILLALSPAGLALERNIGLAWLYKLRGPAPTPDEVAIVAIDERTGPQIGLPALLREWPRSIHAKLIDRLVQLGAAVIVFDIDFERAKDPADDAVLQNSIRAANRVVLVEKLTGKKQPVPNGSGKDTIVWMEQLIPPLPLFAEAARALAPFPVPKTEAAVYDFWAFKPSIGDVATMPVVAFQVQAEQAGQALQKLLATAGIDTMSASDQGIQALMRMLRQAYKKNDNDLATRVDPLVVSPATEQVSDQVRHQLRMLHNLYSGPDERHLNFYGPPGTIQTLPYHRLVSEDDSSDRTALPNLKDKVVFVGFSDLYSPGQIDRFLSVYSTEDGVDLSGVEIAATAYANLVSERSLRNLNPYYMALLLGAFGALLGLVIYALPASRGVPLAMILAFGYLLIANAAFAMHNLWLPLANPLLLQLPLALFLGLMGQYLLERAEKERATKAVGYYLPEHIAADFARGHVDASAINKVVYSTCLASDMAGFTTIAEQKDPTELAAFLNDYFDTVSQPLKRHGVDVTEFRADGIMCAWTHPEPSLDVRRRAVSAALETVSAVTEFKERHALSWHPLRIGLEAGTVFVGHAGGGGRFVYSIVGDSANTAARVEALNKQLGTRLLATRSVVEGIPGLLVRPVGDFHFVGKSEPLSVVEILAWTESATERQHVLAQQSTTALQYLQDGDVKAALAAFESTLVDFPDDGPSRYHRTRCASAQADMGIEYVVRLQQK